MAKKTSFEEQYPGYEIIPEKKRWWLWPSIWTATLLFIIGTPLFTFYLLSYRVPTPNDVSSNDLTLNTLRASAMMQSDRSNHTEAAINFERYFALGGQEADMMALYAFSLRELGRKAEAKTWAKKAVQTDPKSKAARMIEDALKSE